MSRIDCNITVNFLREYKKICELYDDNIKCFVECPLNTKNNGMKCDCSELIMDYPEKAVEIVQKWSDEHPVKTRLDDLNEKYPNYRFYENDQCPDIRPAVFGYCDACAECRNKKQALRYCWDEPLVGGATGKAVE